MRSVQGSDLGNRHLSKVAALDLSTSPKRIILTQKPVAGEQMPVVIRVLYCLLDLPQCVSSNISMLLSKLPMDVLRDTSRFSG